VAPLQVPDLAKLPSVEALAQCPAVNLFVRRAAAVKPDFQITHSNASALAEICARVDGLPLALELAAARIKLLPPDALLARLAGESGTTSLHLLAGGPRDLPARLRTMHGAIRVELRPAAAAGAAAVAQAGRVFRWVVARCSGGRLRRELRPRGAGWAG